MKFLRLFRSQSTNTKDYIKYAVGEVFLVVIGILIALSSFELFTSCAIKIPAIINTISIKAYL